MQDIGVAKLRVCDYGPDPADAKLDIAVVGDSHAAHWMSAFQVIAKQQKWHVSTLLKGSCPLIDARRTSSGAEADSCETWNAAAHEWLAAHPEVRYVVVSASSANRFRTSSGDDWFRTAVDGYVSAWNRLPASVRGVIVIRDVPRPREDVVVCSELALRHGDGVDECGLPRTTALLPDPEVAAATAAVRRPVEVVDLTTAFCTSDRCDPEVGGAFVYRDGHHMTATFGRSLVPQLVAKLVAAVR